LLLPFVVVVVAVVHGNKVLHVKPMLLFVSVVDVEKTFYFFYERRRRKRMKRTSMSSLNSFSVVVDVADADADGC